MTAAPKKGEKREVQGAQSVCDPLSAPLSSFTLSDL